MHNRRMLRSAAVALALLLGALFASDLASSAPSLQDKDIHSSMAAVAVDIESTYAEPPAGYVALQNWWSNLCFSINSTDVYTSMFDYWCNGAYPGQRWYFTPGPAWAGSEYWYLHSSYSGHCLGERTVSNGAYAITWPCPGILVRPFVWPGGGWGIQRYTNSIQCVGIWPEDGHAVGDGYVWRNCANLAQMRFTIYPNV